MKEKIHIQMEIHDEEVDDVIRMAQKQQKQSKRLSFVLYANLFAMLITGFWNWYVEIYWLSILDAVIGLFSLWLIGRNKVVIKRSWIVEQSLKRYKEDKGELLNGFHEND